MNTKREPTQAALAAREIRKELKEAFPNIKFSVRSDNFSMGSSVDIGWENGITEKEVEQIVNKYQYGHFDGSIDMYESSNYRNDIPQAKFVDCARTITDDILEKAFIDGQKYFRCLKNTQSLTDNIIDQDLGYNSIVKWFLLGKFENQDLTNGYDFEQLKAAS